METPLFERRRLAAHALGDERLNGATTRGAELIDALQKEIAYAREQRDALDDETREPWQALIDIDEEILGALRLHPREQIQS